MSLVQNCGKTFIIKINSRIQWVGSGSGGRISCDRNWFFHEIEFMRSNFLAVFMRSKFLIIIRSPDRRIFHEIEIQK